MPTELAKAYDPKEAQAKWLAHWDEKGYFRSSPDPSRPPFTIVIPPPNVTGALHMGHALNCTLQDVLIRWRRMQGYNALWIPGTDHAGIATQSVVEKRILAEEKKTRHDLGRDELVKRIWAWKDQYEARILGQLKQIGASCDWSRTRFTLDPMCARAVRETFFRMFRDGYIYRGKRLVNWDAHLQTAVADDEVENVKQRGKFYYFRYPLVGGPAEAPDGVLIGTTRPETMLGDTAVAVHPDPARELDRRERKLEAELATAGEKDAAELRDRLDRLRHRRAEHLPHLEQLAALARAGVMLELPLVGRRIPLIADEYADPEKGTGAVKITPAHDANDYAVWQRHPEIGAPINILNPDGTINENGKGMFREVAYSYQGLDRYKARDQVVQHLTELGLFDRDEDVDNTIPISDRSKTPIEPYLSDQWFVSMGDRPDGKPGLAQMAMDAVTSGKVRFTPERYASSYLDWLGEKRDWCVSRQLWWGHRIPVWSGWANDEEVWFIEQNVVTWDVEGVRKGDVFYGMNPAQKEGDPWRWWQRCTRAEDGRWFIMRCIAPGYRDEELEAEKVGLVQDFDVLDTWFSSALWPHSTLGWPKPTPDLKYYYPTSVLCTSRDIITLWVARMVLTGLYNLGEVPFHNVYIHPKVMDGFGEGMSKSKGNGVDPLDVIDLYGTDAMRFGCAALATETQDSRMPVANICPHCGTAVPVKTEHMYMRTKRVNCPSCKKPFRPGGPWPADDPELPTAKQGSDRFEVGRNFANKLWNATRFLLLNLDGYTPAAVPADGLPTEDRWVLSRLAATAGDVTAALEAFRFADVSRLVYDFAWSEFCDWYVEMCKGRLHDPEYRPTAQRVLATVLDGILRLVHPVMPFVAESLWHALNEAAPSRGLPEPTPAEESVCIAKWPAYPDAWIDAGVEARFRRLQDLVRGVREVRNRYQVEPKQRLDVAVKAGQAVAADFTELARFIGPLAGVGEFVAGPDVPKPKQAGTVVRPDFEAYVSLTGLIDPAGERKRLEKQIADITKQVAGMRSKLENAKYVSNAPPEVVAETRNKMTELEAQVVVLEGNIRDLL